MPNIEEIWERCEAATRGPWKNKETESFSEIYDCNAWEKSLDPLALVGVNPCDAEFIAHAREDIPFLLDEVEWLQAELDVLRKEFGELADGLYTAHRARNTWPTATIGRQKRKRCLRTWKAIASIVSISEKTKTRLEWNLVTVAIRRFVGMAGRRGIGNGVGRGEEGVAVTQEGTLYFFLAFLVPMIFSIFTWIKS